MSSESEPPSPSRIPRLKGDPQAPSSAPTPTLSVSSPYGHTTTLRPFSGHGHVLGRVPSEPEDEEAGLESLLLSRLHLGHERSDKPSSGPSSPTAVSSSSRPSFSPSQSFAFHGPAQPQHTLLNAAPTFPLKIDHRRNSEFAFSTAPSNPLARPRDSLDLALLTNETDIRAMASHLSKEELTELCVSFCQKLHPAQRPSPIDGSVVDLHSTVDPDTLLQITELMTSDLGSLRSVERVILALPKLMHSQQVNYFLVSAESAHPKHLICTMSTESGMVGQNVNMEGIAGCVVKTGRVTNIPDVMNDWRGSSEVFLHCIVLYCMSVYVSLFHVVLH